MMRAGRLVMIVAVLVLGAGCSTTPKHTYTSAYFPGIASLRARPDGPPRRISLVFIHGMGGYSAPEGDDNPDPLPAIAYVAEELGLARGPCERVPLPSPWRGSMDHWTLLGEDGAPAIHAYVLRWKPTNETILTDLKQADNVRPLERMRPAGTRKLKDELTDRLGDVALYAGTYRSTIQDTVIQGLMTIAARADARAAGSADDQHVIVPVTWSLGSRVLYDTLGRMKSSGNPAERAAAERIPLVFMLANQIQFLELADQPPHGGPGEAPPATTVTPAALEAAMGRARPDRLTYVVGITDPSDLLSWPLPASADGASVRLVNAYHSMVSTAILVPGLGKVGNPLTAHTRYGANAQVLRWLVHGADGSTYCRRGPPPRY